MKKLVIVGAVALLGLTGLPAQADVTKFKLALSTGPNHVRNISLEGFIAKLKQAILDTKDPDILKIFKRSGFIEAKNEDFDGIVKTAKELKLLN